MTEERYTSGFGRELADGPIDAEADRTLPAVVAHGGTALVQLKRPQAFKNGEIHGWYNFVLGFSDTLVAQIMDRLSVAPNKLVLDPFCGTGTTLVESMKRGIPSIGIDSSPFSCFVSRVKTNKSLKSEKLLSALIDVGIEYDKSTRTTSSHSRETLRYLTDSGMIKRGWISVSCERVA